MTNEPKPAMAAPVSQQERITILDSLRGIAILGILLMNIPGFGLPLAQTSDPSLQNETGINFKTWFVVDWALSGTQRAIFSMLFGAGIILFITRLEKKMDGMMPAIYFFRRQLWLLLFGLVNAFVLLWFRKTTEIRIVFCGTRRMDIGNPLEPYMVTLFPVWAIGMVMEKPDLLEKTSLEEKLFFGGYHGHALTFQ